MNDPQDKQLVQQLINRWRDAACAKQIDLLLEMITDDAVFLSPGAPPLRGKEDLLRVYQNVFAQYEVDQDFQLEEVQITGDFAFAWGVDSATIKPIQDGDPVTYRGHGMMILRRDSTGAWKFARGINNKIKYEK
jgi:uncharacterized protein (TIGR02246 family)